ncbi:antitoxin [Clostridia bacterium]|nr:antitoxin [Clostridia bacterium]
MGNKNLFIIKKFLKYIEKIFAYRGDCEFSEFVADEKLAEACVFNLIQIGELVRRLDDEFKEAHPQIHWGSIYNLRNRIVHDYEGIDFEIIWDIIANDLPALKLQFTAIKGE